MGKEKEIQKLCGLIISGVWDSIGKSGSKREPCVICRIQGGPMCEKAELKGIEKQNQKEELKTNQHTVTISESDCARVPVTCWEDDLQRGCSYGLCQL